jgi:DNA-binding GntR family transcriptional regulator
LQVPSIVDVLYEDVRERILTGELPGGSSLTEMSLAVQYSVARPTAKTSMERLVQEGLLRRNTHKTAKVPVFDVEDIRDLYYTRACLEREVMIALTRTGVVPEGARKSLQELRNMEAKAPVVEVVNLDVTFHSELVDAVGSPRLSRLYRSLMGEFRLCKAQVQEKQLLDLGNIVAEHSAILECIASGDVGAVVRQVDDHLDRSKKRLLTHIESRSMSEGVPKAARHSDRRKGRD